MRIVELSQKRMIFRLLAYLSQIYIYRANGRTLIHETTVANTQVIQRLKADKHCFSHQSLFCIYDLGHLLYAGSCSLLIDLPIDARYARFIIKIGFTFRMT